MIKGAIKGMLYVAWVMVCSACVGLVAAVAAEHFGGAGLLTSAVVMFLMLGAWLGATGRL